MSLTLDERAKLPTILKELGEFADVVVDNDQSIICLVGEKIPVTAGIGARVFKALGPINVRMVSQGASSMNFGFIVDSSDLTQAIQSLHEEFFTDLDPEVFAA